MVLALDELYATLDLSYYESSSTQSTSSYSIVAPTLSSITDGNSQSYTTTAGFPTTGFSGAAFTLNLSSGTASNYAWSSSSTWATVSNGVVTFSDTGTSSAVTITAKSSSGDTLLTYSFTIKYWFIGRSGTEITQSAATTYCSSLSGSYTLPTIPVLNGGSADTTGSGSSRGTVGSLWPEWGDPAKYTNSSITRDNAWTASSKYLYIYFPAGGNAGKIIASNSTGTRSVVCYKEL